MTLILAPTLLIVAVSFFVSYHSAATVKKGVILNVTIPQEALKDLRVREIVSEFKRTNLLLFLASLVGGFVILRPEEVSLVLFLMTFWVVCLLVGGNLILGHYTKKLRELKKGEGWQVEIDEDHYWRGGVYNNPHDPRLLVDKRVGYGQTLNIGSRTGKFLYYGTITAVCLVVASLLILFAVLDTAHYTLEITSSRVTVKAPLYGVAFTPEDIQDISLMKELPQRIRTNGAETARYALGNFTLTGFGRSKLYVNKDNPPYLAIKLPNLYVFFNGKNVEETEGYYRALQTLIP